MFAVTDVDGVEGAQRLHARLRRKRRHGRLEYCLGAIVAGAGVGVDEHGAVAREVLEQPDTYGLHYLADNLAVVVRRNGHQQIHRAHVHQLA